MTTFGNVIASPARGVRAMTGPIKAAVALACLLGLAACGGGGGGSSAGGGNGGGNGGGLTEPPPSYLFDDKYLFAEETAATIMALDTVIDEDVPRMIEHTFSQDRLSNDNMNYQVRVLGTGQSVTPTDDPPEIRIGALGAQNPNTLLIRNRLGDSNAYRFEDDWTSTVGTVSTDYEGRVFLWWDPEPEGAARSYHYWGVWLRRQAETGTWDHATIIHRYFNNDAEMSQYAANSLEIVRGMATYTGGANGVYTKDGDSAGLFGADVSVTVHYGGNTVADDDKWTMTGTIDNFVLSGHLSSDWSVALNGEADPANSDGSPSDATYGGTTDGGGGDGVFQVIFWGADNLADPPNQVRPRWVLGKFTAHFDDGSAIGAFTGDRGASD